MLKHIQKPNPVVDVEIKAIPERKFVLMQFASRLDVVAMSPEKAREIAGHLNRIADEVDQINIINSDRH